MNLGGTMNFSISEKHLRIGVSTVVAVVLTAICVWILLPSKNVADACAPRGRAASGDSVNCNRPISSVGNSAPYQSGVSNQFTTLPSNQPTRVVCTPPLVNQGGKCMTCDEAVPGSVYVPE